MTEPVATPPAAMPPPEGVAPDFRDRAGARGASPGTSPSPPEPASTSEPPPLDTAELRLLAEREKAAQIKRAQRARTATERATQALAPNPSGYVVRSMPGGLKAQRKWLRDVQDAYHERKVSVIELTECRRAVSVQAETYKAAAIVRHSWAALRAAMAQERMADVLASLEHGGAAVALLAKLRSADGLIEGARRPLPQPRVLAQGAGT
jgi:hypothetical protein